MRRYPYQSPPSGQRPNKQQSSRQPDPGEDVEIKPKIERKESEHSFLEEISGNEEDRPSCPAIPPDAAIEVSSSLLALEASNIVRPGAFAMHFGADAVSEPLREDVETGMMHSHTDGRRPLYEPTTLHSNEDEEEDDQEPNNEELRLEWQRMIQNQNLIIEQQERRMQQLEHSAENMRFLERMLQAPVVATRVDTMHGEEVPSQPVTHATTTPPPHPPIVVATEIVPEPELNRSVCCYGWNIEVKRRWKIGFAITGLLLVVVAVIAIITASVGRGSGGHDREGSDAVAPVPELNLTLAPTVSSPSDHPKTPTAAQSMVPTKDPSGQDAPPSTTSGSLEAIVVDFVGGSWKRVSLSNTYVAPIPVCSVDYGVSSVPLLVRIQGVKPHSNSFEIRLQSPGDRIGVPEKTVNCLVIEEGQWQMPDGRFLEAMSYTSTITDHKNSWIGQVQGYGNMYINPVVVGQVISFNDPRWSVFWCSSPNARSNPPSSKGLVTGKHVGEDTNQARLPESVGIIVMEAGRGDDYESLLGEDNVRGYGNDSTGYSYTYSKEFRTVPRVKIVSQAGMDIIEGSWAILTSGQTDTTLKVAIDEDQINDAERGHGTEQVAYIVFEEEDTIPLSKAVSFIMPTSMPQPTPSSPPATETPILAPTELPVESEPLIPTSSPTSKPTLPRTSVPTPGPTLAPTSTPTSRPTPVQTPVPTTGPTSALSPEPTLQPTPSPTLLPTSLPSPGPTLQPTPAPTSGPTQMPLASTPRPTLKPTPGIESLTVCNSDNDCLDGEYCSSNECREFGTCKTRLDCLNPSNLYPINVCVGPLDCDEATGTCKRKCTGSFCPNGDEVECDELLCSVAPCDEDYVLCIDDNCGVCSAIFLNAAGSQVC